MLEAPAGRRHRIRSSMPSAGGTDQTATQPVAQERRKLVSVIPFDTAPRSGQVLAESGNGRLSVVRRFLGMAGRRHQLTSA